MPEYSIVVPVYDEEDALPEFLRRLRVVADGLDGTVEVILVDDGSRDRSHDVMMDARREDPRIKVVRLSRNFGHQIAITAGLDWAAGHAVVVMDADLQDPPELIPEMARLWRDGSDVVYAVRRERGAEPMLKRWTALVFYSVLRRLTELELPINAGDYRLVDRRALDAFKLMRERNRYVRGMFRWVGFRQTGVEYVREERYAGRTKYPFGKMVRLAIDAIVSFSDAPLRVALNLGFVLAALSILLGGAAIGLKLAGVYTVPGWTSIIVTVAFLGGVQLLVLGVIGEYIARIQDEVRQRPLYVTREMYGIEAGSAGPAASRSQREPGSAPAGARAPLPVTFE